MLILVSIALLSSIALNIWLCTVLHLHIAKPKRKSPIPQITFQEFKPDFHDSANFHPDWIDKLQ